MKQSSTYSKVTIDMFLVQSSWTSIFLGIMLTIAVVNMFINGMQDQLVGGIFNSAFVSGCIYMFVIGIFSIYFLPHFVGKGVTRKDYFIGSFLASIGLSIAIPIVVAILSIVEKPILNMFNISYRGATFNEVDVDESLVGEIVSSFFVPPFVEFQTNPLLAVIIFSINLFVMYLVGWIIGTSFYRFGTLIGLVSIAIAIGMKLLNDHLLRILLDLPTLHLFSGFQGIPDMIAILGILLLYFFALSALRIFTKRITVKM